LAGCSGRPGRVDPPPYSGNAGAAAIAAYDASGDEAISGDEFDSVAGLRASLGQVDTDGDDSVTAEEIDARVQAWRDTKIAEMPVRCKVLLDGEPLADALVVFEPEPFLGPQVQPASGTTAASGIAGISLSKEHLADPKYAGMACGWYKIKVTSTSQEIPPKYNDETTLGCEVAMDAHWVYAGHVLVELTSK